jgi:hypothetical protein
MIDDLRHNHSRVPPPARPYRDSTFAPDLYDDEEDDKIIQEKSNSILMREEKFDYLRTIKERLDPDLYQRVWGLHI